MLKLRMLPLALLLVSASLHAATIEVRVDRGAYPNPLTLHVGTPEGSGEPHWITSRTVGTEPVRFESLAAGTYVIALSGSAPTERLTQKVNVGSDDERVYRLTVPKRRLNGRVTIGGKPLGNVTVTLSHETWNWSASLTADGEGNIAAPLWDEGEYLIDVRDGALTAPVKDLVTLAGRDEARLDLDFPNRHIRGRVVDEQGKPIANVKVLMRGKRGTLVPVTPVFTNAAGVFDYPGVDSGPHTIRVNRDGYLVADEVSVDVSDADTIIEKNFTLAAGTPRELEVVDVHAKPISGALVLASAGGRVRALANTDAQGRARIATPKNTACAIWVVPDGGSLAAFPLERDAKNAARIVVPDAAGSLDVQTLLSDGTPLSNVNFVLRYNGELAPPDLARMMRRGGNRLSTNADGVAELARIPAGTYELWPYVTDEEAEALVASAAPSKAPVSVTVTGGRQTAVVRFQKNN